MFKISLIYFSPFDQIHNIDVMNFKVFQINALDKCCSMWPISHFILFFILGLLFPDCPIVIVAGIFWEIVESCLAYVFKKPRQAIRSSGNVEYSENWIAGSFKDILFNTAGFLLGRTVIKLSGKKIKLPDFLYCDD